MPDILEIDMKVLIALIAAPLALAVMALSLRRIAVISSITSLVSWLQFGASLYLVAPLFVGAGSPVPILPGFLIDRLAGSFLCLTTLVCACSLTQAHFFFRRQLAAGAEVLQRVRLFYCFAVLFSLSMQLVFLCDNLGYMWIAIEGTTLLSAGLVYHNRDRNAVEATWKYLIICSVGIAFALLGTVFLFASSRYGAVPGGTLEISLLTGSAPLLEHQLRRLGFIFCFLGYGTKAGMFPLHSWLPDAHSEAPAPASAMLSGALLNCALFAIYRLSEVSTATGQGAFSSGLVLWSGAVTVLVSGLFLVRQHGLKRLWAYSSIENVGLMLVAIGLGQAPLFFLQALNHSVAKVALFLTSGSIIQITGTKYLKKMRGLAQLSPLCALVLVLAAVSVCGLPPFGSFIPEWVILLSTGQAGQWVQFGFVVTGLAVGFIAVTYHVLRLVSGSPRPRQPLSTPDLFVPVCLLLISLVLGLMIPEFFWGGP